jgi:hypothetical protein
MKTSNPINRYEPSICAGMPGSLICRHFHDPAFKQLARALCCCCFALLCALNQVGCASTDKSCLVKAIGFNDAYRAEQGLSYRWSKIVIVYWNGKKTGHAFCCFESTRGIMCYDSARGSWLLTKDKDVKWYSRTLAELWAPNSDIRTAVFFE